MESFFHTLKTELVHCDYRARDQARASLFDYVEVFYKRQAAALDDQLRGPAGLRGGTSCLITVSTVRGQDQTDPKPTLTPQERGRSAAH